jgi:hypothetical protein
LNDGAGEALHTIRYGGMPAADADALCQGLHAVVVAQKRPLPALAAKAVHEAITHLENNGERMNCAEARQHGLPIGSGVTEATCKNLFAVRFRRRGSRWHEATGTHIAQLRALALGDRGDAGIALTLKSRGAPVRLAS